MTYDALMTLLGHRITYFLLIGCGGLVGLLFVYLDNEDRTLRTTYQKTQCHIEQAEVTVDEQVSGRGLRRHVSRTYYPDILYSYSVNGEQYDGCVYRAYEMGMTEPEATAVVGRYSAGASATCYYDPANPEDAVLTFDSDRTLANTAAAFGLLFLLAGLAGWVVLDFVLPGLNQASQPPPRDLTVQEPEWSPLSAQFTSGAIPDDGSAAVSSGPR